MLRQLPRKGHHLAFLRSPLRHHADNTSTAMARTYSTAKSVPTSKRNRLFIFGLGTAAAFAMLSSSDHAIIHDDSDNPPQVSPNRRPKGNQRGSHFDLKVVPTDLLSHKLPFELALELGSDSATPGTQESASTGIYRLDTVQLAAWVQTIFSLTKRTNSLLQKHSS